MAGRVNIQQSVLDSPEQSRQKVAQALMELDARLAALESVTPARTRVNPLRVGTDGKLFLDGISTTGLLERQRDGGIVTQAPFMVGAWHNYWADAAPNGWAAAGLNGYVWACRVGPMFFCMIYVDGTSNATVAEITLPYGPRGTGDMYAPVRVRDNGSTMVSNGTMLLLAGNPVVSIYPDNPTNDWTAANNKAVWGQVFFRIVN